MSSHEHKIILIVEDEVLIAMSQAETVRHFGYEAITVNSGEEAVKLASGNENINLILMDLDLGKGINGPEAAKQILAKRNIPIVFLTSHSEREIVERVRGITRYGYVIKNSGDFVLQSSIEMAFELFGAEEAVLHERDRTQGYLDTVETIIVVLNTEGRITTINRKGCQLFGYREDELIGQFWFTTCLPHPYGMEKMYPIFIKLMAGETKAVEYFENPIVTRSGDLLQVAWHNVLLRDEQGQIIGTLSSGENITERKRAQEANRKNLKLLENIINSSADYIYVKDRQLRTLICNETFARALGKFPADLVGKTDIENGWEPEFVKGNPEKGIRGFEQDDLEALNGKTVHIVSEPGNVKDSVRVFDTIKIPLYDDNGEIIGVLGTSRDITERKRAEQMLRESEERYHTIVDMTEEWIWEMDLNGKHTFSNPRITEILGYNIEEFLEKSIAQIIHPEDMQEVDAKLPLLIAEKRGWHGWTVRWQHKDGSYRYLESNASPILNKNGEIVGYRGTDRDITERKLAEESVLESEERFRTIFEEAYLGIVIASPSFVFQKVNPAFCRMVGYTAEELCSMTFADITHPEHISQDIENVKKVGQGEIPFYRTEKKYINKKGEILWGNLVVSGIRDKHGALQYYLSMIDNITERKAVENRNLIMLEVLKILNKQSGSTDAISDILHLIKKWTGMEAVGIRLRDGDDFPYYVTNGFPANFVEAERFLCARDSTGSIVRDSTGNCVLECMCGNIICGQIDTAKPFFTEGGSFWSNSTTKLLAETTEEDRQARTRNRCNSEGYESVALVPIRAGKELIGLIQLNDRRTDRFTPDMIHFLEGIGSSIGIALSRKVAEDKLVAAMHEAGILREKAEKAYQEKELLLREVHHRIKNNMNTMMSILSLQSNTVKNPSAVTALANARSRLQSMGVLYDKLYRSDNLGELSIRDYISPLVDEIVRMFPNSGSVKIKTIIDDFVLGVKVLSPLGIIVNELITNAMKYAFTGRVDGLITVSASIKNIRATVTIEDNGNGIPESVDIESSSGLGFKLVSMLTKQIMGTMKIERRKGTKFVLEFDL